MTHYPGLIRFVLPAVMAVGMFSISRSADSIGVAGASMVRSQLHDIADEVIGSVKFDLEKKIALWVEGEGEQSLAENAFIEALQKRGYAAALSTGNTPEQTLHVFLFGTDIKIRTAGEKYFERRISTKLEARTILGAEREVRLLGTFHREGIDTAQVFSSFRIPALQPDDDESLMQRLLTPLIILSGAVLIIFLLFTVRS